MLQSRDRRVVQYSTQAQLDENERKRSSLNLQQERSCIPLQPANNNPVNSSSPHFGIINRKPQQIGVGVTAPPPVCEMRSGRGHAHPYQQTHAHIFNQSQQLLKRRSSSFCNETPASGKTQKFSSQGPLASRTALNARPYAPITKHSMVHATQCDSTSLLDPQLFEPSSLNTDFQLSKPVPNHTKGAKDTRKVGHFCFTQMAGPVLVCCLSFLQFEELMSFLEALPWTIAMISDQSSLNFRIPFPFHLQIWDSRRFKYHISHENNQIYEQTYSNSYLSGKTSSLPLSDYNYLDRFVNYTSSIANRLNAFNENGRSNNGGRDHAHCSYRSLGVVRSLPPLRSNRRHFKRVFHQSLATNPLITPSADVKESRIEATFVPWLHPENRVSGSIGHVPSFEDIGRSYGFETAKEYAQSLAWVQAIHAICDSIRPSILWIESHFDYKRASRSFDSLDKRRGHLVRLFYALFEKTYITSNNQVQMGTFPDSLRPEVSSWHPKYTDPKNSSPNKHSLSFSSSSSSSSSSCLVASSLSAMFGTCSGCRPKFLSLSGACKSSASSCQNEMKTKRKLFDPFLDLSEGGLLGLHVRSESKNYEESGLWLMLNDATWIDSTFSSLRVLQIDDQHYYDPRKAWYCPIVNLCTENIAFLSAMSHPNIPLQKISISPFRMTGLKRSITFVHCRHLRLDMPVLISTSHAFNSRLSDLFDLSEFPFYCFPALQTLELRIFGRDRENTDVTKAWTADICVNHFFAQLFKIEFLTKISTYQDIVFSFGFSPSLTDVNLFVSSLQQRLVSCLNEHLDLQTKTSLLSLPRILICIPCSGPFADENTIMPELRKKYYHSPTSQQPFYWIEFCLYSAQEDPFASFWLKDLFPGSPDIHKKYHLWQSMK